MTFSTLSLYFQKLEATPSRNSMTEILAELFTNAGQEEIGKLCYLLQGRVAPLYEPIEFGVGDKLMIRAIGKAYGVEDDVVRRSFGKFGDLGAAAEQEANHESRIMNYGKNITVEEVFGRLVEITGMGGEGSQEGKIDALADLLGSLDALSVRYFVRIPLDKLRLGFSDMTILDGLSWMLAGDKSQRNRLEEVYNIRPDIGLLATQIKARGIAGLSHVKAVVGAPILASLCQRLPTADEMIKKMGEVAVEPKFDGVRVQIHYDVGRKTQDVRVKTFSRNLENTTAMFPELEEVGKQLNARDVILDSEAVGMDPTTGKLIPFQETSTRKRKHDIQASLLRVPLKFFVFDILYKDGKDLLATPLSERRKILEDTILTRDSRNRGSFDSGNQREDLLVISPQIVTDSPEKIRQYHDAQIKKGLEGAVVKKWHSPYEPGRRGYSWVKFKEEEGKTGKLTDTIDAVVMGYYRGEGKRAGFGIGAFLVGVAKGEEYVTVTKIGTGVTDDMWKELEKDFRRKTSDVRPKEYGEVPKMLEPDVWIDPKIVVEIAGDDLTKSSTHGAGVAVRFPRLVRIRTDKSPAQATSVEELEKMYRDQGGR
ncbi:MAG: ATP-dependent DNA ligase [Patescibacteria group bacterium]